MRPPRDCLQYSQMRESPRTTSTQRYPNFHHFLDPLYPKPSSFYTNTRASSYRLNMSHKFIHPFDSLGGGRHDVAVVEKVVPRQRIEIIP